jgi:hypothetical protein
MIRTVASFEALVGTPFADGVNALCWRRSLHGDFTEVMAHLGSGEGIVPLAIDGMLADLRTLRARGLAPELNCIYGYPRDDKSVSLSTDVYSFHADCASVEADTWLCTYHGAPSEGLLNAEARLRIEVLSVRTELLHQFGGADDEAFADHLQEACHDLHYVPLANAQPYSFGVGHLWRIALDYPKSPVAPCIHRAPHTLPGDPPRLLLIC